jgi:hypothetical protein
MFGSYSVCGFIYVELDGALVFHVELEYNAQSFEKPPIPGGMQKESRPLNHCPE